MSGSEVGVVAAAGGLLLLGGALALYLRWRHAERRLQRLEGELALYCEASHRVAQTLEEMLLSRVKPGAVAHTSRRYLINQARERLQAGDSLHRVKRVLGLSFDEARLLERGSAFTERTSAFTERGAPEQRPTDSALEPAA